jgi:Tol biopolymer transport system component
LSDAQFCSIAVSYKKNNNWSAPEVVPFSGKYIDADPFVTKDGNTIYFVSNRPLHEGEPAKQDWDIWKVERATSGWDEPVCLDSPLNSAGNEFFPTIADNGDLYFGSDRTGGKGRADIYVSKFVHGKYVQPVNPGDSINTPDNEYEPFIARDESYLIFMATYPNGIAHADFYISYNKNGVWSKAMKLPEPINSYATEWGGKVTRDGKYFFFGSSRNKITDNLPQTENMQQYEKRLHSAGNGLGDIYYVEMSALKK